MRKPRPPRTARNKMMDHLARRDHSEKELREKLRQDFPPEEIEKAIAFGKESGWIPSDQEGLERLSAKTAEMLHRKKKGTQYIQNYLAKKGLPPVGKDPALELEKAQALVKTKYADISSLSKQEKAKVGRFLLARGFDMETVRKIIFD